MAKTYYTVLTTYGAQLFAQAMANRQQVSAVEVLIRGRHTELDGGNSKAGEKTETSIKSALTYYKMTVDGKEIVEIDMLNSVLKIEGKDRYEKHRAAIGL